MIHSASSPVVSCWHWLVCFWWNSYLLKRDVYSNCPTVDRLQYNYSGVAYPQRVAQILASIFVVWVPVAFRNFLLETGDMKSSVSWIQISHIEIAKMVNCAGIVTEYFFKKRRRTKRNLLGSFKLPILSFCRGTHYRRITPLGKTSEGPFPFFVTPKVCFVKKAANRHCLSVTYSIAEWWFHPPSHWRKTAWVSEHVELRSYSIKTERNNTYRINRSHLLRIPETFNSLNDNVICEQPHWQMCKTSLHQTLPRMLVVLQRMRYLHLAGQEEPDTRQNGWPMMKHVTNFRGFSIFSFLLVTLCMQVCTHSGSSVVVSLLFGIASPRMHDGLALSHHARCTPARGAR